MWNLQQLILMKIGQIALALSAFHTWSLPSHPSSLKNDSNIIYEEFYVEKVAKDLTMHSYASGADQYFVSLGNI